MFAPVILDTRTPQEYASGRLPGAILVPTGAPPSADWAEVQGYLDAILGGKSLETPIYIYCRLGKRSATVVRMLHKMGFRHAMSMGGVEAGLLADELEAGRRRLVT